MHRMQYGRLTFESPIDGKTIKVASMLDDHTRESLLNLAERSITGDDLVTELKKCSPPASGGESVAQGHPF